MDFQYYPTPLALAIRAWNKFRNNAFVRVLEPSAGTGELALAGQHVHAFKCRHATIDCCEIDPSKHPVLRDKGLNVVGVDFLELGLGSIYSHVILNPPFLEGAKHVLKAWDMLWDGEVVAIVNAETLRNPYTRERQRLVDLIAQYGDAEFVDNAFTGEGVQREAEVDIALVYLRKAADLQHDIIGDLFDELRQDASTRESLTANFRKDYLPALQTDHIENMVLAFNAAVMAMRESVYKEERARYYTAFLGETMAVRQSGTASKVNASVQWVQGTIAERYADLKDRAWAGILRSTNVTSRLSSKAQQRLEKEFEQIKQLEFTVRNVYAFLCGLVDQQGEIQVGMACDVFDAFTRYHSENTVFYMGFKSNDKHRTCGMRLRTTRFILPGHACASYRSELSWESRTLLADFDKVFAMLDGKQVPEVGLVDIFSTHFNALRNGERVSSSYFDIRYYPLAGTIHFFPRGKHLVDRLNRLVGRHRQWLPPEGERVHDGFWLQFDSAEKLDKELRDEIAAKAQLRPGAWGNVGPIRFFMQHLHGSNEAENVSAASLLNEATDAVLERHGISTDFQIEDGKPQHPLLAAA